MMNFPPIQSMRLVLASLFLLFFPVTSGADDPAHSSSSSSGKDSATQLIKDITAFPQQSSSLGPPEAAQAWLDLFDRATKLQATAGQMGSFASASCRWMKSRV